MSSPLFLVDPGNPVPVEAMYQAIASGTMVINQIELSNQLFFFSLIFFVLFSRNDNKTDDAGKTNQ